MRKRIDKLTEKEKSLMRPWAESWIKAALSTKPVNKKDVEEALEGVYQAIGREWHGNAIITSSPLAMVLSLICLKRMSKDGSLPGPVGSGAREAVNSTVNPSVRKAVHSAVNSAVHSTVNSDVHSTVNSAVYSAMREAVHSAVASALRPVYSGVKSAVASDVGPALRPVYSDVRDAVISAAHSAVSSSVNSAVNSAVESDVRSAAESALGSGAREAVHSAVLSAVESAVDSAMREAVHSAVLSAVESALGSGAREAVNSTAKSALRHALYSTVQSMHSDADPVHSAVLDPVNSAVSSSVNSAVNSAVESDVRSAAESAVNPAIRPSIPEPGSDKIEIPWGMIDGGGMWSAWPAYFSFFTECLGLDIGDHGKAAGSFARYCRSAGWMAPFESFTLVADHPCQIHRDEEGRLHSPSGMAIQWRDGWGFYSWHGVQIPEEWILSPETVDIGLAFSHENIEQRLALCEILGWGTVIDGLNHQTIDSFTDADGRKQSLVAVTIPDIGERKFLHFQGPTAMSLANGQGYLCVPDEMETAKQAQQWTYLGEDYEPEFRT